MGVVRCALVAALLALALAAPAGAAEFFLFDPNLASPGDRVTVSSGTAGSETSPVALTLYLVRNDVADDVATVGDPRLVRLGVIRIGRRGNGSLSFVVPPLAKGAYTVAYRRIGRCPHSGICGGPFYSATVGEQIVARYRPRMVLRVEGGSVWPFGSPWSLVVLAALAALGITLTIVGLWRMRTGDVRRPNARDSGTDASLAA